MFMFNSSRDQCTNKAQENKTIFRACLSLLIIRSQFVYQAKNGFGFQLVGEWGPFLDTFRPFSSITMKRQYNQYFENQERNRIFKPSVLEDSCTIVGKGPVQRPCLSLQFHILLFTLNCNWNMEISLKEVSFTSDSEDLSLNFLLLNSLDCCVCWEPVVPPIRRCTQSHVVQLLYFWFLFFL